MRLGPIGHGANNLNHDVVVGDLRIDVGDANFGILEFELPNTLLDGLWPMALASFDDKIVCILLTAFPEHTGTFSSSTPKTN